MSGLTDLEFDYLMVILKGIHGIGKQTASKIINLRDEFPEFNNIRRYEVSNISRISQEQAEKCLNKVKGVDFRKPVEILFTEKVIEDFLDGQYQKLKALVLEDLDINALLIKALCFTTAEEVIEFYLYQRVTRSAVTSWGQKAIEDICKIAGAEGIPRNENVEVNGKRFDVKKGTEEGTYYIQLKSGPNSMNVGMVDSLNNMIEKIEEKRDKAIGILGMTYGKRTQISSQIRGNLKDFDRKTLIGQELWEFLSGDENYYTILITLIDELSREYKDKYELPFLKLVEKKKDDLSRDWERIYGTSGEEGLNNFIQKYTE